MATAQNAIDKMRIQLAETDAANSRWDDDPHLLFYLNRGRTEFAKQSFALKNIFEQTTQIGATIAGSNRVARYVLDPQVWKIDNIYYDQREVESVGTGEFEEFTATRDLTTSGVPYVFRRVGDAIDLYFAPNEAKILEVYASVLPVDLAALASVETELKDDQLQAAVDYGTGMALMDDDRDPSGYLQKFNASTKRWRTRVSKKGPRFVNVMRDLWPT